MDTLLILCVTECKISQNIRKEKFVLKIIL